MGKNPEYVYALHDFIPEHEDEISFKAGEKIEILERDDLYGDGWWQGINSQGKQGLFPQSYTSPSPSGSQQPSPQATSSTLEERPPSPSPAPSVAAAAAHLDALNEEPEPEIDNHKASLQGTPTIQVNGESQEFEQQNGGENGEMMKATLTDVQKAIEQLGQRRDADGRSFSFVSERDTDGETTDTDFDQSDVGEGEDWHKQTRTKLAEKARRAVEEAEKMERMMSEGGFGRLVVPPIEVEMSDESEDEDDHHEDLTRRLNRSDSYDIPEEDEEDDERKELTIPEPDEDNNRTATRTSFPEVLVSLPDPPETQPAEEPAAVPEITSATPDPVSRAPYSPIRESLIALPSPTGSSLGGGSTKHNSVASSTLVFAGTQNSAALNQTHSKQPSLSNMGSILSSSTVTVPAARLSQSEGPEKPPALAVEKKEKDKPHPNDWNVQEVVDWLKSKGFDQDVCDKFIEQEITGDVLLELDTNLLKSEIGIMAFGKRVRIANAISELRRPPSINYSDAQPSSPFSAFSHQQHSAVNGNGLTNGHPGFATPPLKSHSRGQSFHSSINSPMSMRYDGMAASSGLSNVLSPESPPHTGDLPGSPRGSIPGRPASEGAEPSIRAGSEGGVGLGLGNVVLPNGKTLKSRPAHLSLSPSSTSLNATAIADEEDKAVMSESELPSNARSVRRRLFGRSHDSASIKEKDKDRALDAASTLVSTGSLEPLSSIGKEKDRSKTEPLPRARSRSGRSVDAGKSSDRLSLFGIGGTLGKSRKPAPRYSAVQEDTEGEMDKDKDKDRHPSISLARLYGGSSNKKSGRPSTSDGMSRSSSKEFKVKDVPASPDKKDSPPKDPTLLRKRTASGLNNATSQHSSPLVSGLTSSTDPSKEPQIKSGQSILAQIGEADHSGWMRKKGDRYNSWKLRYFVLKGPHMYCLRSNSKAETKIKGYINIVGYKVVVDENIHPGRYGFRIVHDQDKTHSFSHEEKTVVRDWMKAIMKATIGRDYTKAVISSCNIPTIPLTVAQAMNPAPRPPSPTARDATQKALRRENPHQLSSRDARVLMGLPSANGNESKEERRRLDSFFSNHTVSSAEPTSPTFPRSPEAGAKPPRPSRELRRSSTRQSSLSVADEMLIEWANTHLPQQLRIKDITGPLCGGLALLRLAESIKGRPASPPVPDSAFPSDASDDNLDGLFRLFDFLLDNDVKMGSVSINDVRQGKTDKILQLLKALKAWEDKRKAIAQSIGKGSVHAGAFMAPVGGMQIVGM